MERLMPELCISHPVMSEKDFSLLRNFIKEECGINISRSKKIMLALRLNKRLRALHLASFKEYINYITLSADRDQEVISMLDAVSTNKTDFFREPAHFDYLGNEALPQLMAEKNVHGKVHIWSAGCSSGEEPYTIAMIASEFVEKNPNIKFSITASDISIKTLKTAVRAVYPDTVAENIPPFFRHKYMLRGKGSDKGFYRITSELRSTVDFNRLNLLDEDYGFKEPVHIIFCRNVVIYFDRETQKELFRKFNRLLHPGGYLFLGHSETMDETKAGFYRASPTIYRKPS